MHTETPYTKANESETIEKIIKFTHDENCRDFISRRREVMILIFALTGADRVEMAGMSIDDILNTAQDPEPKIIIRSKRRVDKKNVSRLVQISSEQAQYFVNYIYSDRRRVISKTCGIDNDKGLLLLNEVTGQGLTPNTISVEIGKIAKCAGIFETVDTKFFAGTIF